MSIRKDLILLSSIFRSAIEKCPKEVLSMKDSLISFPNACCDDTSQLLAAFFADNGITDSYRLHGKNIKGVPSHVWLKTRGFVVDITADQFNLSHKKNWILLL